GPDRLADPGLDGVDEPEADGEAVDSRLRGEGGLLGVAAAALSGVGGGGDGVLELGDERVAGDLGGGGGEVHRGAPSGRTIRVLPGFVESILPRISEGV